MFPALPATFPAAIALAAVVLAPLATAAPAWAATPASVVVQAPAPGAALTGVTPVTARAQPADPGEVLESLTIGIRQTDQPPAGVAPFQASYTTSWPGYRQEPATVTVAWDTAAAAPQAGARNQPSAANTVNGRFRLTAEQVTVPTALGLPLPGRNSYAAAPVDVVVNNPPAVPRNVTARLEGGSPVVRWVAGAEPDLLGYQVLRSAGGPAARIGTVGAGSPPSFVDASAPAGVPLTYRVVAVRHSPLTGPADGCASLAATCVASASSSATPALALAAPGGNPGGGTAGQGARQPLTLDPITSAPLTPVAPPPTTVTAPAGDLGFAPTLPYPDALPEGDAGGGPAAASGEGPGSRPPGSPARFAAGALLLVAIAAHLANWGRRILRPAAS